MAWKAGQPKRPELGKEELPIEVEERLITTNALRDKHARVLKHRVQVSV
jgi:hypothetical protein